MKKKVMSILLIATLLFQFAIVSFADEASTVPATKYQAGVSLEVRRSGASSWTGNLYKSIDEKIDFKATVDKTEMQKAVTEWYEYGIDTIKAVNDAEIENEMRTKLAAREINGSFEVKIDFSNKFDGVGVEAVKEGTNMDGFNEEAKRIFYESKPREYSKGILTITISTKSPNDSSKKLTIGELCGTGDTVDKDLLDKYIPNLEFSTDKVTLKATGTYKVNGYLDGTIDFLALGDKNVIEFVGSPYPATAYVTVKSSGSSTSSQSNSSGSSSSSGSINLDIGTGTINSDAVIDTSNVDNNTIAVVGTEQNGSISYGSIPVPSKDGYVFTGWYADADATVKYNKNDVISNGSTVYAGWAKTDLEMKDHYAYVLGYPDETVRPENTITREEVTTIFYRLLKQERRSEITTIENSFNDIDSDRWSNKAISSSARGGYINGYEDGNFAPENAITRAEFAAMASRYVELSDAADASFSDIEGHWASGEIAKAAQAGWITGYENGTFRPDSYITRAEAMAIINRMLSRSVNANGIHANAKQWADNDSAAWYYYIVLEATNSHTYARNSDGLTETWTSIMANRDWSDMN